MGEIRELFAPPSFFANTQSRVGGHAPRTLPRCPSPLTHDEFCHIQRALYSSTVCAHRVRPPVDVNTPCMQKSEHWLRRCPPLPPQHWPLTHSLLMANCCTNVSSSGTNDEGIHPCRHRCCGFGSEWRRCSVRSPPPPSLLLSLLHTQTPHKRNTSKTRPTHTQ
jgi:hypothetical protein